MEWVETTGRTIEEAKDAALDQLGVDETDAEFVVLTEPRPGLFGRLRGEARVRARVRPTSPRPKRGRGRRPGQQEQRRGGQRQSRSGGSSRSAVLVAETASADAQETETDVVASPSANGAVPARPAADSGPSGANRNRRRRRRGSGRGGAAPGAVEAPGGWGDRGTDNEEGQPSMTLSLEEQGEAARTFVAGLLEEMGLEAQVTVRTVDDTTAEVSVDGSGLGILIGPGGATLGAVQELTRTVVQKHTGGHSERILVDVAGYRAKRAAALQRFSAEVAQEVLSSGSERALEPMSASDRKVVHDTVNEIPGVQTRSEGEDPRRYIVISSTGDTPLDPDDDD